jgi:metal-responsive CopG/Arc/MetJ family transcriptional regulator
MRATKTLTVSLPPQLARETERTAREERCTKSELVREALRFYLQERRWKKLQRETARRAETLGIRTEEDVDQLVHDARQ